MRILRPTWAEVDLKSITQNARLLKKYIGKKTDILAVVKADAYGHGAAGVARALEETPVKMFGVATVEEGIELRQAGIKKGILILGSIYPFSNFKEVIRYNLTPTLASAAGIEFLDKCGAESGKRIPFHLKIDTGMARIGLSPSSAALAILKLKKMKNIVMKGVYTHLACGDTKNTFTGSQIVEFKKAAKNLKVDFRHIAASASIINYPDGFFNMVRPGLLIYGLLPFKNAEKNIPVAPAMSLKTRIVFMKTVAKNVPVSYGRTFYTRRQSRIATVAVGYADGFSRTNSNNACMLVNGRRAPVIGRVCMDMCMLDVTGIPGAAVGSEAVVMGAQGGLKITAEEIAQRCGTINYEVVTSISKRVPRVYKDAR